MWTKLKYCRVGDYIRAYFLGNYPPDSNDNLGYHEIYRMEKASNGNYYVAIEGWRGGEVSGEEDVFKKD